MTINVIGGGLAGCEAAQIIARANIPVRLWEMRPVNKTPVHQTGLLAELVCSNSLKSELSDTAQGLLKQEMKLLGSLLLECAESSRVPAGGALAVDRLQFSQLVTEKIKALPNVEFVNQEVNVLPKDEICIIATGPLTSESFAEYLQRLTGSENLYFFDAIAPSVTAQSLNNQKVFRASRYDKGTADYLNCPFTQEEYQRFYEQLIIADSVAVSAWDDKHYFQACMPIEAMGGKGIDTLCFGPMRPVGLISPHTGDTPYAVVQLRQEDQEGEIYGLVGFQTRLRWGEQKQVFRLIPGLEQAEFVRFGSMHRNTFINSPQILKPTLQSKEHDEILWAGQITGVEGYMESAASGLLAGLNAVRMYKDLEPLTLPRDTLSGALINYITTAPAKTFQPMNANFGLLPPLPERNRDKKKRASLYVSRALRAMTEFVNLL